MHFRMTDAANEIVGLAKEQSLSQEASYPTTLQVLLAIFDSRKTIPTVALSNLAVEKKSLLDVQIDSQLRDISFESFGQISAFEASVLGHSYIGPEHLLLGICVTKECLGAYALETLKGGNIRLAVCKEVISILGNSWRRWQLTNRALL